MRNFTSPLLTAVYAATWHDGEARLRGASTSDLAAAAREIGPARPWASRIDARQDLARAVWREVRRRDRARR